MTARHPACRAVRDRVERCLAPIRVNSIAIAEARVAREDSTTTRSAARGGVGARARHSACSAVAQRIERCLASIAIRAITASVSGVAAHDRAAPGGACGGRIGASTGVPASAAVRKCRHRCFTTIGIDSVAIGEPRIACRNRAGPGSAGRGCIGTHAGNVAAAAIRQRGQRGFAAVHVDSVAIGAARVAHADSTRAAGADRARAGARTSVSACAAVVDVVPGIDFAAGRSISVAVSESRSARASPARAEGIGAAHVAASSAVVRVCLCVGATFAATRATAISAVITWAAERAANAFPIRTSVRRHRTASSAESAVVEVRAQITAARAATATGAVCARHDSWLGAAIACSILTCVGDDQPARLIALDATAAAMKHTARKIRYTRVRSRACGSESCIPEHTSRGSIGIAWHGRGEHFVGRSVTIVVDRIAGLDSAREPRHVVVIAVGAGREISIHVAIVAVAAHVPIAILSHAVTASIGRAWIHVGAGVITIGATRRQGGESIEIQISLGTHRIGARLIFVDSVSASVEGRRMNRGITIVAIAIGANTRHGRIQPHTSRRTIPIEIVVRAIGCIVDEAVTILVSRDSFGIVAGCAHLSGAGEHERIGVVAVRRTTDVTIGREPISILIAGAVTSVAILIDSIATDFLCTRMNRRDVVIAIARAAWVARGARAPAVSVAIFAFGIASVAILIDPVSTKLGCARKDARIVVVAVFAFTACARVIARNRGPSGARVATRRAGIGRESISVGIEIAAQRTDEEHLIEGDTGDVVASGRDEVFARIASDCDEVDHGTHGPRQRDRDADRLPRFDVGHGPPDWAWTRTARWVVSGKIDHCNLDRLDVPLAACFEQNRVLCWSASSARKEKRRQEGDGVTD